MVPISGCAARLAVTISPSRKVDGGQVVCGRWPMASGAYQAGWAAVGIGIADGRGEVVGPGLALIPIDALDIDETWDMTGMRGTGSHTLSPTQCSFPTAGSADFGAVLGGRRGPGAALSCAPWLDAFDVRRSDVGICASGVRPCHVDGGHGQADGDVQLRPFGRFPERAVRPRRCGHFIDTARLHLYRSADIARHNGDLGGALDPLGRARCPDGRRPRVSLFTLGHGPTDSLGRRRRHGRRQPLQRHWRDLQTAARRPTINTGLSREIYGRAIVGNPNRLATLCELPPNPIGCAWSTACTDHEGAHARKTLSLAQAQRT